jgi:hypothetical protein
MLSQGGRHVDRVRLLRTRRQVDVQGLGVAPGEKEPVPAQTNTF